MTSPLAAPASWELVAPHYEYDVAPLFRRFAEEALRLAAPSPEARVLDVAAGTGTLALLAARSVARVDAVDFAPTMVERLQARAAELGMAHVRAQVADGQSLPFDDATFDAAFSLAGVIFFPDRARGLAELARVVRPGGTVVVSSWPPATGVIGTLFRTIAELSGAPSGPGPALPLGDAPSYARELGAAGLREVHVVEIAHAAEYDDVETLVARQERTMVPLVLLRRRSGDEWPQLRARLVSSLHAVVGDGRVVVELPALMGIGRKP